MGSAVKKIVSVAAIAATAFYGGQALAGYLSGGSALGAGVSHLGTAGAATFYGAGAAPGVGASLFGATALQKAGIGLQGLSYLGQRKFASAQANATKQAAEEAARINKMQERVRMVQERRQALDIDRQRRIQEGGMTAQTASSGLGLRGTSGYVGGTGAIQSQATANLTSLNMASGASTAISRASQRQADYESQANYFRSQMGQWEQIGGLGAKLYDKGPEIYDFTKSIFKTV
jgi:hypothetical protein